MALSFDAAYYMTARPDVLNAYIGAGAETGTGMNWAQFAEQHFNDFGWKEGSNPNAVFDTSDYLAANTDVLNAGVNPFTHYLYFGANEGRAPSASFIHLADFDWETYLAANSDLTDAGIVTAEAAYGHYVIFGQFENRPGVPSEGIPGETYTLTIGEDNFTGPYAGGPNDDVYNAPVVQTLGGTSEMTLKGVDQIDGGGGRNTLNATLNDDAEAPVLSNVQVMNLRAVAGLGIAHLDLSNSSGIEEINSDRSSTGTILYVEEIQAGAQLGMKSTMGGHLFLADYADGALGSDYAQEIVLTGNNGRSTAWSGLYANAGAGDAITSMNMTVSGNNFLYLGGNMVDTAESFTLSGSGNQMFMDDALGSGADFDSLIEFDSTGLEGNLRLDLGTAADAKSIKTGSGDDTIVLNGALFVTGGDAVVDFGEGNNQLILAGVADDADLNALDFSDVTPEGFNTGTLQLRDDVLLGDDATLDLEGIDVSEVNFLGEVDGNGYDLTIANSDDDFTLRASELLNATLVGAYTNLTVATTFDNDFTIDGDRNAAGVATANSKLKTVTASSSTEDVNVSIEGDMREITSVDISAGVHADLYVDSTDHALTLARLETIDVTSGTFRGPGNTGNGDATVTIDGDGNMFSLKSVTVAATGLASGDAAAEVTDVSGSFTVSVSAARFDADLELHQTGATSATVAAGNLGNATVLVDGDNNSLETLKVSSGATASIDLEDQLYAFKTLDVSGVKGLLTVHADMADYNGSPVTYLIGHSDDGSIIDLETAVVANSRETIKFVGSDIGDITIDNFELDAGSATSDRLDFSQFAGINSAADLVMTNNGGDLEITAAAGQFDGTITIVGAGADASDMAQFHVLYA